VSSILAITYDDAIPVTASDSVDDPAGPFAGFHTGAGGTIKVTTIKGTNRTITNMPAGVVYPLAIRKVWATPAPPANVLGMVANPFKKAVSS
jgi:hypothetical protein